MSYNRYLCIPSKKKKESSSHENTHTFSSLAFYQLKRGQQFKFGGLTYTKKSDSFAVDKRNRKRNFWPQDTIKLLKRVTLEELNETYPLTAYDF